MGGSHRLMDNIVTILSDPHNTTFGYIKAKATIMTFTEPEVQDAPPRLGCDAFVKFGHESVSGAAKAGMADMAQLRYIPMSRRSRTKRFMKNNDFVEERRIATMVIVVVLTIGVLYACLTFDVESAMMTGGVCLRQYIHCVSTPVHRNIFDTLTYASWNYVAKNMTFNTATNTTIISRAMGTFEFKETDAVTRFYRTL